MQRKMGGEEGKEAEEKMHNFRPYLLCNLTIFRFNALISWDIKEMKLTRGKKCSKMAVIKI